MKSALTVEDYVVYRNIINIVDYSESCIDKWKRYPVHTIDEFLELLSKLKVLAG